MPNFKYTAKKSPTELKEGILEASNRDAAVDLLNRQGLVPVKLELVSGDLQRTSYSQAHSKVSLKQVIIFTGQLSRLVKTGVPILKALAIIEEQTASNGLSQIIDEIIADVRSGAALSICLAKYPLVFPGLYIAIIRSGENTGNLSLALDRVGGYLIKEHELRKKVKFALIYPCFMLLVGLATVVFMLVFVVPKISSMYVNLEQQLPWVTSSLLWASQLLKSYFIWFLLACILIVFVLRNIAKRNKILLSKVLLAIPLYNGFIVKSELARFSASLELSLKSGINILKAVDLAIPVMDNEAIKKEISSASERIRSGGAWGVDLKKSNILPKFFGNLVSVGEESGRLDEMFAEIARYFQEDTDDALKVITSYLEPVTILIVGIVLSYVIIAMLLPILQLNLFVN
ncbi:MAG: type II secretion system F family protein [Candidatus Omnitrophica bacterium]|jgi:type II secretory pathway component PulF|nr:type II secretion system F family protein [Candidatus Omnitrophota bacterium]